MNISQFTNNSGYITGYTETDTLASVTGRGASTASQVSFTKTDDHAISVGTIRGRAVGSQGGEFIQLYERVNIGGPSGWGASNTGAPTYGLSVYGGANIGYGNNASLYAYAYRGNGNVGGTGEASWHPAGIYSGGTQWLYGTTYRNNANTWSQGQMYFDGNYGYGMVGLYASTRYQAIFAMGDAYKLPVDGTSTGSLYGLAWSHPNAGGVAGNLNTHGLLVMENGTFLAAVSGSIRARDDMRAPIFYDSQNTGFYLDPNGTSNLNQLTTNTRAKWNMPRWWMSREDYTSDQNYWTGTNGWGTSGGTWANAWRGGFSGWDIWGTGTDHPQGGGYVHAQGIVSGQHLATSDGSSGYGWMMVGAADAVANRYWLRGKWSTTTSGWVEMITTGNIGSQSVSNSNTVGGIGAGSFVRNDTYNSANAGLQVFRNIGNTTPSWPDSSHTFGLENNDAGHIVLNFHRAGYTSNNLVYNGSTFSFDMSIVSSGDVTAFSDRRVKENINTIENALEKVKTLRGVTYNRTDQVDKSEKIGVIAQEVREILPQVVQEQSDGMLGVSYGNITAVLIEAIKEQQKQIEDLKSELNAITN
jgi:hypothetical protein